MVSQEQQDRVEQQVHSGEDGSPISPVPSTPADSVQAEADITLGGSKTPADKKKAKRKTKLVSAEEVMPKPSIWPLLLAVSIAVMLFGILSNPVIIGVGAVLIAISALGWILERR